MNAFDVEHGVSIGDRRQQRRQDVDDAGADGAEGQEDAELKNVSPLFQPKQLHRERDETEMGATKLDQLMLSSLLVACKDVT